MLRKIVISTGLLCLLVACKSTPKPSDPVKLTDIQATASVSVKWRTSIGKTDSLAFTPVYSRGSIIAANERGQIHEIDYQSGRILSSVDTRSTLVSGVAVAGDLVIAGDSKAQLLAFNRSNRQPVWTQKLTTVLAEAPLLVGNIVITRTKDGRLSGFDPQSGQALWTFANNPPTLNIRSTGTMLAVSEQLFLVAMAGGGLAVINAQTGDVVWGVIVATPTGVTDLDRATEVVSRPAAIDGVVCAVAFQGRVGCFEAQTGNTVWAHPASSSKGLDVAGNFLVLTEDDGTVKAFNRLSGQLLWHNQDLRNRQTSAPVILPNGIVVGDFDGYIHLLDFQTGRIIGRTKSGMGTLTAQPARIEQYALMQGKKGDLSLIQSGAASR